MELKYDINKPWETLDEWQKKYIEAEGNCFLLCGRQCGKSTAASIKCGEIAVKKANSDILVIAFTERQAYELFFKILNYLEIRYPNYICRGKDKPTKHEIHLKNKSIIRCHAAGQAGEGLRTYTCTKIFVDEAAPMSREIFTAVTPMLSVTGGSIDLLSTPRGKEGYFYEASLRNDFMKFYVSAENCPRHKKEFLESEKASMSVMQFAQEYLAVFLDELQRIFSDELLKKCCIWKKNPIPENHTLFLGIDVARLGEDDTTFQIVDKISRDDYRHIYSEVRKRMRVNEVVARVLELDKLHNFKTIYVDDGGVGGGVFDYLLTNDVTKRKVVAINNAARPLDRDETRKKKILKEDLYNNLLMLMEQGKIKILAVDEVVLDLKSVQFEYILKEGEQTKLRIFSTNGGHIVEGLIRAAWASRDKSLNIWVHT